LSLKNKQDPLHPCSRKYRMSGWFVSKIKNLYLRTYFSNGRFCDVARMHH